MWLCRWNVVRVFECILSGAGSVQQRAHTSCVPAPNCFHVLRAWSVVSFVDGTVGRGGMGAPASSWAGGR